MSYKFGKEFKFGFSTVGVQHEMGLPNSEFVSDWTIWLNDEENIVAGVVSGDKPENGPGYWHLYREDHDRAKSIGMDAAWITIEWARLFPKPTLEISIPVDKDKNGIKFTGIDYEHIKKLDEYVNKKAVDHYKNILRDWREKEGMVIACLFHWSLPIWLHNPVQVRKLGVDKSLSGWVDEKTVIEFTKFAAYIAYEFDEFVDMWYTINEPLVIARLGYIYISSGFPPGYLNLDAYKNVVKHLIEAHARSYEVIKIFSKKSVGIVESISHFTPYKENDEKYTEKAFNDNTVIIDAVTKGVYKDNLQEFEREDLRNKLDWIGLNYYTRTVVTSSKHDYTIVPGYGYMCQPRGLSRDGRPCSDFGWEVYPEGIYHVLKKLYKKYNMPIYVTENGIADALDVIRSRFIVSHLYWIYRSITEGVDVKGYFHWNLIDNLEWAKGYSMKFGLFYVDMATKKRYPRPSVFVFKEIATNKAIPEEFEHMISMQI